MVSYTEEDWRSLKGVIYTENYHYDKSSTAEEKINSWIRVEMRSLPRGSDLHLHNLFFDLPLEDMPLHINNTILIRGLGGPVVTIKIGVIAAWRLKIGK